MSRSDGPIIINAAEFEDLIEANDELLESVIETVAELAMQADRLAIRANKTRKNYKKIKHRNYGES